MLTLHLPKYAIARNTRMFKALEDVDFDLIRNGHSSALLKRRLTELAESGAPLGIDTETTGLDPLVNQVRLVQVASKDYALIVDLDSWRKEGEREVRQHSPGLAQLKALLESSIQVIQNAAFDLNFLAAEGVEIGGSIFDTMIAAKLVNNGTGAKNDLGNIVLRVLKLPLSKNYRKLIGLGTSLRKWRDMRRVMHCAYRACPSSSKSAQRG